MLLRVLKRAAKRNGALDAALRTAWAAEAAHEHDRAEVAYRRALAIDSAPGPALWGLAALLGRSGRSSEACTLMQQLQQTDAANPASIVLSGNLLWQRGHPAAAEQMYREAADRAGGNVCADAHMKLGMLLRQRGADAEALTAFQSAYRADTSYPGLVKNIVEVLLNQQRPEDAQRWCRQALAEGGESLELAVAEAHVLHALGETESALQIYARFAATDLNRIEIAVQRGVALQDAGQVAAAAECFDHALTQKPGDTLARWHRGLLRLLRYDFDRGWDDYDYRLRSEAAPRRATGISRWRGERFNGRKLLVYGEQGLGDQIMFASCLPDALDRAAHVTLEIEPRLHALMRRSFPALDVIAPERMSESADIGPVADCEIPLGSLPAIFRRARAAFPQREAYLQPAHAAVAAWRETLTALGPGLKIGVSWQGGTWQTRRRIRSLALDAFLPALHNGHTHCVSLQHGDVADEIRAFETSHGIALPHWPAALQDIDQLAALMCAVDVVVTVCNTTVHLGGALGCKVLTLVPKTPEWRYGLSGTEMPWYPNVRLYRQTHAGQWSDVFDRITADLQQCALEPTDGKADYACHA